MPVIKLETILPALQTLKSVTSIQGDQVTFHIQGVDTYVYCYDRGREIQIFGKFAGTSNGHEDIKFSISLERFRTLLKGQKKIALSLTKEGLQYATKTVSGTIEVSKAESFEFPKLKTSNGRLSETLYNWVKVVKLNVLFRSKEDMLVFIKASAKNKTVHVSCADNYHTALLTTTYKGLEDDFNIVLPVRYVDIANKLMEDDGVHVALDGDITYFYNENLILRIPTLGVDSDHVNLTAIQDFTTTAKQSSKRLISFDSPTELKAFIQRTKSMAEEDRDNRIVLKISNETLSLFTETKHGTMRGEKHISNKSEVKEKITLNAQALFDLVSRIGDDRRVYMAINPPHLYMMYNTEDYGVELTAVGIDST